MPQSVFMREFSPTNLDRPKSVTFKRVSSLSLDKRTFSGWKTKNGGKNYTYREGAVLHYSIDEDTCAKPKTTCTAYLHISVCDTTVMEILEEKKGE